MRSWQALLCGGAACAALSGCIAPILPVPRGSSLSVGEWSGSTSQGMPISFSVTEDETVTTITVGHRFDDCMGTQTFANLAVPTAQDVTCIPGPCSGTLQSFRQFGFQDGRVAGVPQTMVRGLFLPGGRAEGQASFIDYPACGTATVEWTATRR